MVVYNILHQMPDSDLVMGSRAVVGGVEKVLAICLISLAFQTSLRQSNWTTYVCLCLVLGLNMVKD